ncbi:MAG: glycosyltransferase [bacterium]
MRLYLCDHLLRDVIGHHLGYNLAIADAASMSQFDPVLVTHRDFDTSLAGDWKTSRLFHTDHRANPPSWVARHHQLLWLLEKWSDWRFGMDLKRFSGVQPNDLVFAQMVAPRHFLQWLAWMRSLAAPPALFIHLGYRPGRFASAEITHALKGLPDSHSQRIRFVTDSEKLVEPFSRVIGRSVHYLPHIISYDIPLFDKAENSETVTIFVPGNARREKGFVEVVRAAEKISSSSVGKAIRFVIQCHEPDLVCAELLRSGLPDIHGVEWIDRPLSNEEYLQRLTESDLILLPYHLDCYEMRTSGVFTEARVAGKPVISTNRSWAGDRIAREGGGWLVEERDVDALVEVLLMAQSQFARKRAEAIAIAARAREEFHRDAFLRELLQLLPKENHAIY